jgi:uncharacterized protein (DUF2141 family)
MRFA